VFRGISNLNLDAKGRIAIPTKYRDEIKSDHAGEMMLTVDHADRCLVLYPMTKWLDTEKSILELPNLSQTVRKMKRLILGHASEVSMDGQGRIMISGPLREYAEMDKKLVLIGQGDKFELWREESWSAGRDVWVKETPDNIQNDEDLKHFSI
jgi:MraZ protein